MIRYEVRGSVAWLTLDRPEKLNAMTREFMTELGERLDEAAADESVRSIVFHGEGKHFSVGGDIEGFGDLSGAVDRRNYLTEAMHGYRAVEECPKPTIAAVHGYALGGGCELTMVCDLVVADETARFGTPEASVGLFPGPGIVRGRAHVNLHTLKYMIFTGTHLNAEQAREAGLANEVVPAGEHLAKAEEWAGRIAERSPLALASAKAYLSAGGYDRWQHAVDALTMLQGSEDHAEGIAAFVDRRPAVFPGR
jgi:enoyl-CoA hydratase/carnithine racemase